MYAPVVKVEGEMELGRTCRRCKVIVEITLNGRGSRGFDCIHLDQEWHQCFSVEETLKNLGLASNAGEFLACPRACFYLSLDNMAHSQQNHRTLNCYRLRHLDDAGSILKVCPLFHFIQHCSCDQIEKNDMIGACSTCGGEDRCMQGFGGET